MKKIQQDIEIVVNGRSVLRGDLDTLAVDLLMAALKRGIISRCYSDTLRIHGAETRAESFIEVRIITHVVEG